MKSNAKPMPKEFLSWQVALRHHTMHERNGAPHVGVVPVVCVKRPGAHLGVVMHNVVCGLLPAERLLEARTREFREIYERHIREGARAVYDAGIQYLLDYYASNDAFDAGSITSMVPAEGPLVDALRADPRCSLVFNVFDTDAENRLGNPRCQQLDCFVDVLESGAVFENVWWHNTLFHGKADGHVVLHFKHDRSFDTRFGGFSALRS